MTVDLEKFSVRKLFAKPGKLDLPTLTNNLTYGIINSILTIPCMYGYAAIIFSHPDFATFMPALSKLVMFSSVVHQIMFTLLSPLPFAIGQVQDAGLIFLSAMATSICDSLGEKESLDTKVATTVVVLGLANASMGLCFVLMGKLKLAGIMSYLPMPVVGGYLAYIGLFCLYAGLALCTGLVMNDIPSLGHLGDWHYIILCIPGLLGGLAMFFVTKRCENSLILSGCIVAMPVLFYIVLFSAGSDIYGARDYGWISREASPASFIEMWQLFNFSKVKWSVIPQQLPRWVAMVCVVAFSSCLDVAAIEMDMGQRFNLNHELSIIGWSNAVSGLLGGYAGSYVFSQTILTYRSGTNSRVVGVCVILAEALVVLLPVSVMSNVPRFFFAAMLIFVAIDLLLEWLVLVYRKLMFREYIVLWASFIAINLISLEIGMLIGLGVAFLNFLLGYTKSKVVNRLFKRSSAIRKHAERVILNHRREAIVYLELSGYLYFGSSLRILEDVQKLVHVEKPTEKSDNPLHRTIQLEPQPLEGLTRSGKFEATTQSGRYIMPAMGIHYLPFIPFVRQRTQSHTLLNQTILNEPEYNAIVPIQCLDGSPAEEAEGVPTEFVVMDFSRVCGMDATAAHSSFMILQQQCKRQGIIMLFADVLPEIQQLLRQNEIADDEDFFPTADIALEYCENQLLDEDDDDDAAPLVHPNGRMSDRASERLSGMDGAVVDDGIPTLLNRFMGQPETSALFESIDRFFYRYIVPRGHTFYRVGEYPEQFFFLATGRVEVMMNQDCSSSHEKTLHLLCHVIPGALFGEVDFFANQRRLVGAKSITHAVVYEMTRANYNAMEHQAPELWKRLREVVIHSMALSITNNTCISSDHNAIIA
ncbi:hypothetical protein Poli38472_009278 [Pythium oligandrum]|uniref:Sulfate Permease (SulP) Family n=1 Tax=Pythium oligandrum TaxID=41045 RepID=A0A8K1CLY3_PYTOL|nr:hypothetical protein Poli38472_009278 [Pythium oligandrum]|eukprot:TMW65111.1 hypothetical protein Poli38472_009278 [Pythium oligandrum]